MKVASLFDLAGKSTAEQIKFLSENATHKDVYIGEDNRLHVSYSFDNSDDDQDNFKDDFEDDFDEEN